MLLSCKISSAVLGYFESEGLDPHLLLESTSLPEEFLNDPSYWMKASEMEDFLRQAIRQAQSHDEQLLRRIGHAGPKLRVWGLLDSVLRMMPRPQEILAQPGRFLSYFVSPEPPVENILRNDNSIEFDLPVSTEMYPLTTEYLKAAFETLPEYVGRPRATADWQGLHLKIEWESPQKTMFVEDPGHQISPELMRSIVASLENHQKELQRKNSELQAHNDQLIQAQKEMEIQIKQTIERESVGSQIWTELNGVDETAIETLRHHFARLSDYMVRAQQLITLMAGANRSSPVVREAMKRVDWEWVQKQFPETVDVCRKVLQSAQQKSRAKTHQGDLHV